MDRVFYWKVGLIVAIALFAAWLLTPTFYYFKLPADQRNQPEKLAEVLPAWAPGPKTRVNLGLDLQGGIHLVLGVDTDTALRTKVTHRADQLVSYAAEKGVSTVKADAEGMEVKLTGPAADLDKVKAMVDEAFGDMHVTRNFEGGFAVAFQEQFLKRIKEDAVDQALKVISNRVNRWGVTEPIIAKRGDNAILVQLPGFKDPAKAKELLGQTAQLEFKIVDDTNDYFKTIKNLPAGVKVEFDRDSGRGSGPSPYLTATGENARQVLENAVANADPKLPEGHELGLECIPSKVPGQKNACEGYRTYLLFEKTELTGDTVIDARVLPGQGPTEMPYVSLTFDKGGAAEFERITEKNVGNRMAIVLDKTVNSAPVIQEKIGGGTARITMGGLRDYQQVVEDANDLALVLKAGALPAPVTIGEERSVGASLGPELIRKGSYAVILGLILVFLFMVFYYRTTGVVADVALALNAIITLAAMAAFNATITLPGIAGFVLTLGMAVDANVLINERIREELRLGKTPRAALEAGYGRAFWTIFDSNLTTLIAGFVLLNYGSGPVRGFAVMLIIGLTASMFTAIFVTRVIMDWLMIGRGWNKIAV